MSRTLYLFVTSERPDQYLNSVAHCVKEEGVRAIEYISVRNADHTTHQSGALANQVSRRVTVLLEEIVNDGFYRHFKEDGQPSDRVDLREIYPDQLAAIRELYRPCLNPSIQYRDVDLPYLQLREKIRSIALTDEAIADITSVKKSLLGDILAASVVEGLDRLYTFDLLSTPDHKRPWTMLLHDLLPAGKGYAYVNLVETTIFKQCSGSILVRPPFLRAVLWSALLLLALTTVLIFFYGENWLAKWSSIISAVATFIGLGYTLLSVHRK
jgi:hypothetical protein